MGEIERKVEAKIDVLINEFRSYPEKFLTEEDLRGYLYSLLLQAFGQIERGMDSSDSIPLHCEVRWYGNSGRLKLRSDIVIIKTSTLRTQEGGIFKKLASKGYKFNEPLAIIELKLRRKGRLSDNAFMERINKDRTKLSDIRNDLNVNYTSYLLVFDKKKNLELELYNSDNHKEYYIYPYEN